VAGDEGLGVAAQGRDFRERAASITQRHTQAISDSVHELGDLGLVQQASVQIRVHHLAPLFKLYLLNNEEAFFGFYPVREHKVTIKGETRPMYDLMGKDAVLFHHTINDDDASIGTQYVEQARAWFDSIWTTVSHQPSP
jgi:hypothetical protein